LTRQFALILFLAAALFTTPPGPRVGIIRHEAGLQRWGSAKFREMASQAMRLWQARRISEAAGVYQRGYEEALAEKNLRAAVWFLIGKGGASYGSGHYRQAMDDYLAARELARASGLRIEAGVIASNLSSLYYYVNDPESALAASEEAYALMPPGVYSEQRCQMLMQLGRVLAGLENVPRATRVFEEAIEDASARGDSRTEAQAWELMGQEFLRSGELTRAESALSTAYRFRLLARDPLLSATRCHLALLKLRTGDLDSARHLIEAAFAESHQDHLGIPDYLAYLFRAQIRSASGDLKGALTDYLEAAAAGEEWRSRGLSADEFRIRVNVFLDEIYGGAVETTAQLYLQSHDPKYAELSWQLCERNRTTSLHDTATSGGGWRRRVPPEYWDTLGRLRRLKAAGMDSSRARELGSGEAARLRMRLAEMEARAVAEEMANTPPSSGGAVQISRPERTNFVGNGENFLHRISLNGFGKKLGGSRILVSFRLGEKMSYRWTITDRGLTFTPIAGRAKLAHEIRQLLADIAGRSESTVSHAESLYSELFGGIESPEGETWYVSLDDELFELPLVALVSARRQGTPVYLIEQHPLQVVPGAWAVGEANGQAGTGGFVGVGDGVYNTADSRYPSNGETPARSVWHWFGQARAEAAGVQLPRLLASRREISRAAELFGADARVLTGVEANHQEVLRALQTKPRIVHIASHFISEGDGKAAVILGLRPDSQGRPQLDLLTGTDIASLSVPGAIVIMSGCSSGSGQILPAAGLLGLARSWLAAGARSVIATHWATPDDTGNLFARFYAHLGEFALGDKLAPAEALRRAQIDMLRSGNWRSEPQYWAAYQIVGRSN
jgi:CHAT domain-containing protein/tetratricopeptide (TPR) repeat protein